MSAVRRKTAYDRREEFRYAREEGILLSWDRYERMLPQDGFSRLGLSCFDCLLGPCRLDPFARTEERTVCGFGPDDLTYRTMMRLLGSPAVDGSHFESIVLTTDKIARQTKSGQAGSYKIGPGVLEPGRPNVCTEIAAPQFLETLAEAGLNVVTVGTLASGYSCAASLGDAELLFLTGMVDAYVTCPRCIGRPRGAAEALGAAVISCDDPDAVINAAKSGFEKRVKLRPDSFVAEITAISMKEALEQAKGRCVVVGGESNLKLTSDALALEAAKQFAETENTVVICGGAAAALAKYGLSNVLWCCEDASVLLELDPAKKPLVLLPELAVRGGMAEAVALGAAGYAVLTATELPLGGSELGARINKLARYIKPEEFLDAAKGVLARED